MSRSLISHSADLKRLEDDGYEVEVRSGYVLLKHIPYVAEGRIIRYGVLVSELTLAGDATTTPSTHVVMFAGAMPCDAKGRPMSQISHSSGRQVLVDGLVVDHSFSSKPPEGYPDYYQKMTTYEAILSGPAQAIDPNVTARTFAVVEAHDEDS
ncbi:MAG: ThiF family adenylyltransferase, partial [Chloroflexi bacterium]|nr:ThiF family adenylyltransferase [Chloroflexota bacterium]